MNESRRLKRGLSDLSPLFGPDQKRDTPKGFYCLSVFSPNFPGDSLFLNAYLASRIATAELPGSILSVDSHEGARAPQRDRTLRNESFGIRLRRITLSWDQLEALWNVPPVAKPAGASTSHALFLDFNYSHPGYFRKLIPILDQWILLVQPTTESLTEAYKMIKATVPLNPRLEYFLLFDGSGADPRGGLLFERFSEMAARRLGIHLVWLGSLHFPKESRALAADLALDHLFLKPVPVDSVEKMALASLVLASSRLPDPVTV